MLRTAVVFQTHFWNAHTAAQFEKLRASCPDNCHAFVLMHVPSGTPKPTSLQSVSHHFVTTPKVRNPAYIGKSAGGSEWRIWRGGHTDLPVLHFFNAHPEFDAYWMIEYDVRFTGKWGALFQSFENGADLTTTNLRRRPDHPDWRYWATLRRVESDAAHELPASIAEADQIASFMPIYRASIQAMRTMDGLYREGWTGHVEVTWPTLLNACGLVIEDFGSNGEFTRPQNRGRYYSSTPRASTLSPGSLVWRPVKWWSGVRPNRLVHPVRDFESVMKERWWDMRRRLRPRASQPGG